MKPGEAARHAAVAALGSILDQRKPFDDAFAQATARLDLEARDRAFAHALIGTSLRRKGAMRSGARAAHDEAAAEIGGVRTADTSDRRGAASLSRCAARMRRSISR